MMKGDTDARLEASAYPLIVFVHVPKTAGSTVKKVLHYCTPRGLRDAQDVLGNSAAFLGLARRSDWVGGHVHRDRFGNSLIWLDRPVEYFASVREPLAQLVSHVNWSFEKYHRGNYYYEVGLEEQQLDAEVMSTDLSCPAAVISLILRHSINYLNCQSRYVLGADFTEISDAEISRRLATYTYVASETDLHSLYRSFGFLQLPQGFDDIRANAAKLHFDPWVFYTQELQKFLAYHHKHDFRLYAAVRAASWAAGGRRPFRPAFLWLQDFTFENFDEQAYLDSNPDIANAVRDGHFRICARAFRELRLQGGSGQAAMDFFSGRGLGGHAKPSRRLRFFGA